MSPDLCRIRDPRLSAQIDFILQADKLKSVVRKNLLHNGTRRENAAEHSWHLSLLATVFSDYAPPGLDLGHVTQLLIVHDLVEVYAGDHWELAADPAEVARKESLAAETVFGLLPADQGAQMLRLWREFDACCSVEAKFAKALDAIHPMLLIWGPGGSGQTHTPLTAQEMKTLKHRHLCEFPALWDLATSLLDEAVDRGILAHG